MFQMHVEINFNLALTEAPHKICTLWLNYDSNYDVSEQKNHKPGIWQDVARQLSVFDSMPQTHCDQYQENIEVKHPTLFLDVLGVLFPAVKTNEP